MKDLIECIAKALVDDPASVSVTEVMNGSTKVLELRVRAEDMGKIIGKQGKTAQALRTIVNAASVRLGERAVLEIVDTE